MPSLSVFRVLFRELTTSERVPRRPEPSLVMDDPQNVDAYSRAATVDRVLSPVYLFNAAHISDVVKPGDLVLDLGCGPATQLGDVARLNPGTRFIGLDLSEPMLASGRDLLRESGISNVELKLGDLTDLRQFPARSMDAVISTLTLHHLPDEASLDATFREVARVLRPGGGLFLLDFGRLRSVKSMHYFAHQYADRQSELFTVDYWNSLQAAFSVQDFRRAAAPLAAAGRLFTTFLAPYMVAFKSPPRRPVDEDLVDRFRDARSRLASHHQTDLADLRTFFRLGGLNTRYL